MSVQDPDGNKPGNNRETYPYTYKRVLPSGTTIENRTYTRYARNRGFNVSSPVRYLAGDVVTGETTPWRDPTNFYRNIIKEFPHPYTQQWVSGAHAGGTLESMSVDLFGYEYIYLNEFLPMFPTGGYVRPEYDTNDYNRCVTECLIKIGDGKANLAESLVTYKQSVDMLAQTTTGMLRALLAARRGNWKSIPEHLGLNKIRNIPDGYLQWRFGWLPLASDIKAIFDEIVDETPKAKLLTARRTIHGSLQTTMTSSAFENRLGSWTTTSKYMTACQLTGRLSDEWLRRGTQFGLNNPLALAWEIVPYSFVIDWLLPVGNLLQAFTAPAGLDFVGGFTHARLDGEKTIKFTGPRFIPEVTGGPAAFEVKRFGFRRDVLYHWPVPLPYVKSPLSSTHTETALALLTQLLR